MAGGNKESCMVVRALTQADRFQQHCVRLRTALASPQLDLLAVSDVLWWLGGPQPLPPPAAELEWNNE